ncbi:MAG: CDP-diacylglycerol--glycerol-3-phosphate 3-phosphatidyltransferase [Syntrophomonadaceae bacterium]|nr:CDP-diacylglycerol--glycerol-3-phosphate 3-phosphatidyltransferase [Syntrophomonadaceae bacterium]
MNLPNKLTLGRVILIPVFLAFLFIKIPYGKYMAAGIFIIAALTDGLDGYLARSRHQVSRFGKLMDPLADKLLITAALVSLVALREIHALPAIIIIGREFAVSGLRSLAATEQIVISASSLGKIKTITQVVAITVILLDNYPFRFINFPFDQWALWIAVFFTLYSGIDYFLRFRKVLRLDSETETM